MDEIRLKISLEEARAVMEALRLGMNPPVVWLRLARRIELRLIGHEYAHGGGGERQVSFSERWRDPNFDPRYDDPTLVEDEDAG